MSKKKDSYQLGRKLGLSTKDAKSPRKVRSALDAMHQAALEADAKRTKRKEAAKKAAATRAKNKKHKQPERKGVAFKPGIKRDPYHFEQYLIARMGEFTSARDAKRAYRAEGYSIGDRAGDEVWRKVQALRKNYAKSHFKMFGRTDAPHRVYYPFLARYYYLVRYDVETDEQPEPFWQYANITEDFELAYPEIIRRVFEYFNEDTTKRRERYRGLRIVPDSIIVLYGIDTWRRTIDSIPTKPSKESTREE